MDARVSQSTTSPPRSIKGTYQLTNSDRYDPTIEDSYSITRTVDGETYLLTLTDTAGQEEYRGLWQTATTSRSDAFLLVYDITQASTLPALDHFATLIDSETETRLDRGGVPPVRIVAGNKCDLQSQREVMARQGLEWARARKCGFMETSAREMVNVEETFARRLPITALCPLWLTTATSQFSFAASSKPAVHMLQEVHHMPLHVQNH